MFAEAENEFGFAIPNGTKESNEVVLCTRLPSRLHHKSAIVEIFDSKRLTCPLDVLAMLIESSGKSGTLCKGCHCGLLMRSCLTDIDGRFRPSDGCIKIEIAPVVDCIDTGTVKQLQGR